MYRYLFSLTALFGLLSPLIHADSHDAAYLRALRIAEKKVARMKTSSAVTHTSYTVGQTWEVAALSWSNTASFHSPSFLDHREARGKVSYFKYEVIEAQTQPPFLTKVRITSALDPRLESLDLVFQTGDPSSKNLQLQKIYRFKTQEGKMRTYSASVEGIHSATSPLELFPLDFPDLRSAESKKLKVPPTIPNALLSSIQSHSQTVRTPSLTDSRSSEQDDFFGRPIQVIWESGAPWPSYYRTANGIAVLLSTELQ